jgi:hypothetical protein
MVKLKVLKCFYDREKGTKYNIGDEIEVSEKRADEILAHSLDLAEKIEEPNDVPKTRKKKNVE